MNKRGIKPGLTLFFGCLVILVAQAAYALQPFESDGAMYAPIGENPATDYMIRLQLGPPDGAETQDKLSILFGADREGNGYRFEAGKEKWTVYSVQDGEKSILGTGKQEFLPSSEPVKVLIKNRPWLLSIVVNGQVLLEVNDVTQGAGMVAVDAGASSPAAEPNVQAVEAVDFSENFMRVEDELDLEDSRLWTKSSGQWRVHSVRDNIETVDLEDV
ncbi:MAG: hypothetical protein ACOC0A_01255, partial [Planctomycetota bacterium]